MKKTKTETLPFYVIAQYQVVRKSKIEITQKRNENKKHSYWGYEEEDIFKMRDNFWSHIELILITYDQSERPASKKSDSIH